MTDSSDSSISNNLKSAGMLLKAAALEGWTEMRVTAAALTEALIDSQSILPRQDVVCWPQVFHFCCDGLSSARARPTHFCGIHLWCTNWAWCIAVRQLPPLHHAHVLRRMKKSPANRSWVLSPGQGAERKFNRRQKSHLCKTVSCKFSMACCIHAYPGCRYEG
jgi:hypothetical protein